jgi:hypothetical protein
MDPDDSKALFNYLKPILRPIPDPGDEDKIDPVSLLKRVQSWLKPDRHSMQWLGNVMEEEIRQSREQARQDRLSSQVVHHI